MTTDLMEVVSLQAHYSVGVFPSGCVTSKPEAMLRLEPAIWLGLHEMEELGPCPYCRLSAQLYRYCIEIGHLNFRKMDDTGGPTR